ncbi:hypothetical protein GCM10010272_61090 [Streptomyces lateritius]|nr:hypothetical protein GCM10010272_61090 [Streptomyces lateritius]
MSGKRLRCLLGTFPFPLAVCSVMDAPCSYETLLVPLTRPSLGAGARVCRSLWTTDLWTTRAAWNINAND